MRSPPNSRSNSIVCTRSRRPAFRSSTHWSAIRTSRNQPRNQSLNQSPNPRRTEQPSRAFRRASRQDLLNPATAFQDRSRMSNFRLEEHFRESTARLLLEIRAPIVISIDRTLVGAPHPLAPQCRIGEELDVKLRPPPIEPEKLTSRAETVSYQSVMGTRSVVWVQELKNGWTKVWKSVGLRASVADQSVQSSLV